MNNEHIKFIEQRIVRALIIIKASNHKLVKTLFSQFTEDELSTIMYPLLCFTILYA